MCYGECSCEYKALHLELNSNFILCLNKNNYVQSIYNGNIKKKKIIQIRNDKKFITLKSYNHGRYYEIKKATVHLMTAYSQTNVSLM